MIFTATEDIDYSSENSLLRSVKTAIDSRADINKGGTADEFK